MVMGDCFSNSCASFLILFYKHVLFCIRSFGGTHPWRDSIRKLHIHPVKPGIQSIFLTRFLEGSYYTSPCQHIVFHPVPQLDTGAGSLLPVT